MICDIIVYMQFIIIIFFLLLMLDSLYFFNRYNPF